MKGKCELANVMKAYRGNECRAILIFNLDARGLVTSPKPQTHCPRGYEPLVSTK